MERFVCNSEPDSLSIPPSVAEELACTTPEQLHLSSQTLEIAARRMERSGWIRLPFCNTLCAEGLGAAPVLSFTGARIKAPPYGGINELPDHFSPGFPRMTALLAAMDRLAADGAAVAYSIEGPFTLLTSLLPMGRVFATLRKSSGCELLSRAEKWIGEYADIVCAHKAKVLSFADPVATPDIIGQKMFAELYVPCMRRVLSKILGKNWGITIFLCGKMTQGLLDSGTCHVVEWVPNSSCTTFGEALSAFCAQHAEGAILGHFCLNLLDAKRPYVEQIVFDE